MKLWCGNHKGGVRGRRQALNTGRAVCFAASLLLGMLPAVLQANEPDDEQPQQDMQAVPAVDAPEVPELPPSPLQAAAGAFRMKCAGCHTIGGGALSGPDLKPTLNWPRENLVSAILRMEQQVGPMSPEEVEGYADLLHAPDARELLDAEQQRVARARVRDMEPASAPIGQRLFEGRKALANGGLSCAACHAAGGRGGNLASDLTHSFTRMGEFGLRSAIEGAHFPVMRTVYGDRPVTEQEAAHIAKYLESVAGQESMSLASLLGAAGFGGAALFLGAMAFGHPRRKQGTRARLVANSTQTLDPRTTTRS